MADRLASLRVNSDGREVFPDALKALQAVLTAEELDEYHLRNSPRASSSPANPAWVTSREPAPSVTTT